MSSARSPSVSTGVFDGVERLLQIEATSGIALLSAAATAPANLPANSYRDFRLPLIPAASRVGPLVKTSGCRSHTLVSEAPCANR